MITYFCPKCGGEMGSPDSVAGKQENCPTCGAAVQVPLPLTGSGGSIPPAIPLGQVANNPQTSPDSASDTKACPYCGEQIKVVASVCRFCGMNLQTGTSTKAQPSVGSVVKKPVPIPGPAQTIWSGKPSHVVYFGYYFLAVLLTIIGALMLMKTQAPCFLFVALPVGLLIVVWAVLDCACTRYLLTNQKATCKKGIIGKRFSEVDLKDIRNIVVNYGILERIFGIGSVGIAAATARTFEVRFLGIEKPDEVKELISQAKENLLLEG